MGNGDWGLGIGDWAQSPIPNPQSPIPNPQSPIPNPQKYFISILILIFIKLNIKYKLSNRYMIKYSRTKKLY